jgi:hypothetical protein
MSYEDSSRRKGCITLLVVMVFGIVGFLGYSTVALNKDKARLRTLCAPSKLLEVYRGDLYRVRSEETRESKVSAGDAGDWRTEGGGYEVVSKIPLTAEMTFNRLYLMHGQTKVAALRFGRIASLPVLMIQPSTMATCDDTAHGFYIDLLKHEFNAPP